MAYQFNTAKDYLNSSYSEKLPLKRNDYTNGQILDMFNSLKTVEFTNRTTRKKFYTVRNIQFTPNELLFMNKPYILWHMPEDYTRFNILSDMFLEDIRLKCRLFIEKRSPEEYFFRNKEHLANICIKQHKKITNYLIRETLYTMGPKECTSFRPLNLIFIIRLFNVKSVLDFSSGWGDRLIACLATNTDYIGIDPNKLLLPRYNKMIKFFKHKCKINLIQSTIQDAKLPNKKVDLVFTSPPYFDMEEYPDDGKVMDATETIWFNKFLVVAINKCIKKLKTGGHLVLVINQKKNETYIRKMIDYINQLPNMHYYGVISYTKTTRFHPQPMWVWKKSKSIPEELYNDKIIIQPYTYNKISFNVFADHLLIGGTKQRALVPYMKSIKKNIFIYAGPTTGYAQIALAYAAQLTKKKVILFLRKQMPRSKLTKYANTFASCKIIEYPNANLKYLQKKAKQYHITNPDTYLFPFGGHSKKYIKTLTKSINNAIPKDLNPPRIWLVAGSATILAALYKVFPKSYFMVIQVGKTIWPDQIDDSRTTLLISDESFIKPAKMQPPYPSVATYDAKLWKYFMRYGLSGDFIWNVGKDL